MVLLGFTEFYWVLRGLDRETSPIKFHLVSSAEKTFRTRPFPFEISSLQKKKQKRNKNEMKVNEDVECLVGVDFQPP